MKVNRENFLYHLKKLVNTSSSHGLGFRENNEIDEVNRENFINGFNDHRCNIIKTARQTGSTTMLATLVALLNVDYPEKEIIFIAPKLYSGLHFLNLVEKIYGGKLPGINEKYKRGNVRVISPDSRSITPKPTDLVIFDQAAFINNFSKSFEDFWYSLKPGGKFIVNSTPTEPKGRFYELYKSAMKKENDFNPITLHSFHKKGTPEFEQIMKCYIPHGGWKNELLGEFLNKTRADGSKIINIRIDEELNDILEDRIRDLAIENLGPLTMSEYLRNLIINDLLHK